MKFPILLLSFGLLFQLGVYAQDEGDSLNLHTIPTTFDIFEDPSPMKITLTLDLKKFQREKHKGEYMPVLFLFEYGNIVHMETDIRIKARGNFRREFCTIAPFWLNIRKVEAGKEHLPDVKRLKVVTHCKKGRTYSEYVLKEYLAYRIYNLLSPESFRVRLVHMTYIDTGRKNEVTENWAFLIEPEEMLAERMGGVVAENDKLTWRQMRPEQMDVAALFNFMIGNTDFSVWGRHNMKILALPDFPVNGYTPVPYDFDYSGIVHANYAIPADGLDISSVRHRYYLGPCRQETEYQKTIDHIRSHRETILELVENFPYLEEKDKKEMTRYLEGYFKSASNPGFIRSNLRTTCL